MSVESYLGNRRSTFDLNAIGYDHSRPKYPSALVRDLVREVHLNSNTRVLETGPVTGQLTVDLALEGSAITAVEMAKNLAEVARHKLSNFPKVEIQVTGRDRILHFYNKSNLREQDTLTYFESCHFH